MKIRALALCFVSAACVAGAQVTTTPKYTIRVFPPRQGFASSMAVGINDAGQVVVEESTNQYGNKGSLNSNDAYVWSPNGTVVNVLPYGQTGLDDITGMGGHYVTGYREDGPFRYDFSAGLTEQLGTMGIYGYPAGMNSHGDVCGVLLTGDHRNPAVWPAGTTQPNYFFPEGTAQGATVMGINNLGAVMGFDRIFAGTNFWIATNYAADGGADTVYTDFATTDGTTDVLPGAINDVGMVAGTAKNSATGMVETILWTYGASGVHGQVIVPPQAPPLFPTSMNNAGLIVGGSTYDDGSVGSKTGSGPAWLYSGGRLRYLKDCVAGITPGYQHWYPVMIWRVNGSGVMVGTVTDGNFHYAGFVATPIHQVGPPLISPTLSGH
ncbi:MAG TPA: hypothetical protein VG820_14015 [Fimbriimonadaceae bacterium]|nr:hypothetical protein [Fimbriimonadaceae bacterium]